MGYIDVLDTRVYIPMMVVVLIPIALIKNLKYLVPFSALANVFILVSFVITLYYIFSENLEVGKGELMANVEQLPLFLATVIFAMEGIGIVSTFSDIFVSMRRKYFKSSLVKPKKVMASGGHVVMVLQK
jgi:amino acid permease